MDLKASVYSNSIMTELELRMPIITKLDGSSSEMVKYIVGNLDSYTSMSSGCPAEVVAKVDDLYKRSHVERHESGNYGTVHITSRFSKDTMRSSLPRGIIDTPVQIIDPIFKANVFPSHVGKCILNSVVQLRLVFSMIGYALPPGLWQMGTTKLFELVGLMMILKSVYPKWDLAYYGANIGTPPKRDDIPEITKIRNSVKSILEKIDWYMFPHP